jgi:hypothetical protein
MHAVGVHGMGRMASLQLFMQSPAVVAAGAPCMSMSEGSVVGIGSRNRTAICSDETVSCALEQVCAGQVSCTRAEAKGVRGPAPGSDPSP